MYSGIHGTQLKVDIFIGLVYYQRLRHMVHDKSQARSTGPVDILTQQPLKGRKKGRCRQKGSRMARHRNSKRSKKRKKKQKYNEKSSN